MKPAPLRLAVVTETYPPEVNGVALTLQRVVDGLRARQHCVQLIRPRQHGADTAVSSDGYTEVLMRGMQIPHYPDLMMGLPATRALLASWRRQRPDLVHIATEGPLGWSALQAARRLGLPVCSDFRTNFHAYSGYYGLAWLQRPVSAYLRWFHNRCGCTMVPTERLRSVLCDAGFQRLAVVMRGVDIALFHPERRSADLRASWGVPPDGRVALYVGRVAPEKNLGTLAAAFRAMRQAEPALRLVVVGDGPAQQALASALPDAIFAGRRSGVDLAAHYASADMFIFPSLTETFGNVTTEALASGLAVLAFDHAAAGQLITHGLNGALARAHDDADFVAHAVRLASDADACRRMGAHARRLAAALNWDCIVAQIEAVYADAIAGGWSAHEMRHADPAFQPQIATAGTSAVSE